MLPTRSGSWAHAGPGSLDRSRGSGLSEAPDGGVRGTVAVSLHTELVGRPALDSALGRERGVGGGLSRHVYPLAGITTDAVLNPVLVSSGDGVPRDGKAVARNARRQRLGNRRTGLDHIRDRYRDGRRVGETVGVGRLHRERVRHGGLVVQRGRYGDGSSRSYGQLALVVARSVSGMGSGIDVTGLPRCFLGLGISNLS